MMHNNNHQGSNQQQVVMEPPLYFAEDHVWNVCFHPSADVLACSEITGQIEMYFSPHIQSQVRLRGCGAIDPEQRDP